MKIVEILLENIASIVAKGFVYNKMFDVSIDSCKTRIDGAINSSLV